jgi:hypothetical protein
MNLSSPLFPGSSRGRLGERMDIESVRVRSPTSTQANAGGDDTDDVGDSREVAGVGTGKLPTSIFDEITLQIQRRERDSNPRSLLAGRLYS